MPTKAAKEIIRNEYLIDRHLVVLESDGARHCVCLEFKALGDCRHTRECEGRRAAQGLIFRRVRSAHGTLVGFGHRNSVPTETRMSRQERTRSLAIVRVR
jgi:hypothetical protein